jgi:hypothetical protein
MELCMQKLFLLELLAHSAFPNKSIDILNQKIYLTNEIESALRSKDSDQLKKALSSIKNFANESHVTHI